MRMSIYISLLLCSPPVGKGALSVAFVHPSDRPSVRPSVAYIANNSSTRRPSVPKFGTKIPNLWCDWHTSFKVKRSKVKVTRPINADTHRAPYLPNGEAYELQTRYTDGGRRPASATGAMTSKVKGQGRKVTRSVCPVLAQCCTCVISGRRGIPYRVVRTRRPHFFVIFTQLHNMPHKYTAEQSLNTTTLHPNFTTRFANWSLGNSDEKNS